MGLGPMDAMSAPENHESHSIFATCSYFATGSTFAAVPTLATGPTPTTGPNIPSISNLPTIQIFPILYSKTFPNIKIFKNANLNNKYAHIKKHLPTWTYFVHSTAGVLELPIVPGPGQYGSVL